MNSFVKKGLALAVTFGTVAMPSVSLATDAILKVRTVEQVSVSEVAGLSLGVIAAAPNFKCIVPQRVDYTTAGAAESGAGAGDGTLVPTVALGAAPSDIELCNADASPGFFTLSGVPGQKVKVTLSKSLDNAVGTFTPEAVFGKLDWASGDDELDLTAINTAVSGNKNTTAEVQEAINNVMTQIFSSESVYLSALGKGVLSVGGTLSVTETLAPDSEYTVNYIVNVVYE